MKNRLAGFAAGAVAVMLSMVCLTLAVKRRQKSPAGETLTERVEQVVWRTELRHAGCPQGGFWRASGPPRKIEAYGIDKWVHLHVCSGCGATNEIYDARWPQFRQEWRAVK